MPRAIGQKNSRAEPSWQQVNRSDALGTFTEDYDWRIKRTVMIAFGDGMKCLVTQACAAVTIAAGKAVPQTKTRSSAARYPGAARLGAR